MRLQHAGTTYPPGREGELRSFYCDLLGLTELDVPEPVADRGWIWLSTDDPGIELHFIPNELEPDPARRHHFCLQVEDLDRVRATLGEAGYEPSEGSGQIPGRPRFFVRDPFGNLVEFVQIA